MEQSTPGPKETGDLPPPATPPRRHGGGLVCVPPRPLAEHQQLRPPAYVEVVGRAAGENLVHVFRPAVLDIALALEFVTKLAHFVAVELV